MRIKFFRCNTYKKAGGWPRPILVVAKVCQSFVLLAADAAWARQPCHPGRFGVLRPAPLLLIDRRTTCWAA